MLIPQFFIDKVHFRSVAVTKTLLALSDPDNPTKDDLIDTLSGKNEMTVSFTDNDPEFEKLRNELAAGGYIVIASGVANGDRVKRQFILNGHTFTAGDTFYCGAAMRNCIKSFK